MVPETTEVARDCRYPVAMRVLVTGGAGFIGSHFVRRLAGQGTEVAVLDKLTYAGNPANLEGIEHDFFQGDIADPDAVASAAAGCDAIVNFAAETHVDRSILGPPEFIQTDVFGTTCLLEWARVIDVARFLQVSTDEVYGEFRAAPPPSRPTCCVRRARTAPSKAGGELQCSRFAAPTAPASISRGGNTFGPYQYPEKLVPLFVTNALEGEPLPVYGDGMQVRDRFYVEDHCAGIELVLERVRRARSTTSALRTTRTWRSPSAFSATPPTRR